MTASPAPVFLDRDGTLIVEKKYLSDPEQVRLEAGVVQGLALLQARGHPLIVLSNQSGVGRGVFAVDAAERVNARTAELLRRAGVDILAWYLCPHAPADACGCRKPLPGMALAAARDWRIELRGCFVIGDKRSDVELADAIGGTGMLLTTGHGLGSLEWARENSRLVFEDLFTAAMHIQEDAEGRQPARSR